MTRHRAAGEPAARRRQQRADRAAEQLAAILEDAVAVQTRRIVAEYRREAAALVAAGPPDEPSPPVPGWRAWWDHSLWATALEDAELLVAGFVVDELDVDFGIRVASEQPLVRGLAAQHVANLDGWSDRFRFDVGRLVDEGHAELASVRDVADALEGLGVSTRGRAEAIARTELVGASNGAVWQGAQVFAEPGDMKEWLDADDARVRDDHRGVEPVPFGQKFSVGGYPADRPHDPLLPPEQSVNCRCALVWIPA